MTELRTRPGDQPLPSGGRESVQDLLIDMIRERRNLGIARYGSPLMTHNGRDAAQDALEEALDLATYLLQVRLELRDLKAEQRHAVRWLADITGRTRDDVLATIRRRIAGQHTERATQ